MKRKQTSFKERFGAYFADHGKRFHACVAMLLVLLTVSALVAGLLMVQYKDWALAPALLTLAGVSLPVTIFHVAYHGSERVTYVISWVSTVLSIGVCTCFLFAAKYVPSILFWAPIAGVSAMLFLDFLPGFTAAIAYFIETSVFLLLPQTQQNNAMLDGPFKLVFFMVFFTGFILGVISALVTSHINATLLENQRRFRELAFTDSLTGLHNHSFLVEYKKTLHIEEKEQLGVLFIDVDDLKHINDTYGHPIGNLALMAVGQALATSNASEVIRFGGDEFLIIQENTSAHELLEIGNQMVSAVKAIHLEDAPDLKMSCSVGAYCGHPRSPEDLDAFIREADKEVYIIKRSGKDAAGIKE